MAEIDVDPCFVPQQIDVVDGPVVDALLGGGKIVTR